MRGKRRIQRRGVEREPIWGRLDSEVKEAIRREARHFNCSYSFILNVAAGQYFAVPLFDEDYKTALPREKRKRRH